jgi:primosomal replication protein N
VKHVVNHLVLTGCITEIDALRYTPAGLPALNLRLEHESDIEEAGQTRQVKASIKALALGALAERLVKQALGSDWSFSGFLATSRNSRYVVFHIQEFQRLTNS